MSICEKLCTDLNNDGAPDYVTRLEPPPSCLGNKVIKVVDLNLADTEDLGCAVSQGQQFGIEGADLAASDSLCANSTWNLTAKATAFDNAATMTVSQGVAIRIPTSDSAGSCL